MGNQLLLTSKALTEAPNLKAMFELPALAHNSIVNYHKTRGGSIEGAQMAFEREKLLFMKAVSGNEQLEKCDRFSIYSAWIELMASGLSLNEGQTYIIPRSGKANFQIGYMGRLEQINMLPNIQLAPPAQVVYMSDEFDYEVIDGRVKIIKHKMGKERGKDPKDLMMFAYLVLTETNGEKRVSLLQRHEIIAIRDQYSQPYNTWKSKGSPKTGKLPIWVTLYDGEIVDNPAAFKKTVIIQTYKTLPKTARMKALDDLIKNNPDAEDEELEKGESIDYGIMQTQSGDTVDKSTGEVIDIPHTEEVKQENQKPGKLDIGDVNEAF